MKEYEKALDLCTEWYESNPNCYFILLYKGDIYFEMEKYPSALRCYDKVLNHSPNDETALKMKANVLIKMGNVDAIKDILSKIDPNDIRIGNL